MSLSETESFSRTASLSDSLEGSPPFVIHGVAIGPGDVTKGQTGNKKKWPASTLREAAASLQGRPLVRDHINTSKGVVGTVTDSRWKENVGVIYEAELDDRSLAEKIDNGRLEVSARIKHPKSENLDVDEQSGALLVDRALFDNLSIVPTGAAPSNQVDIGSSEMLSETELREEFDYITEETIYDKNEQYAVGEMSQHRWQIPDWDSTTQVGWDSPNMSDFGTDELEEIADHFMLSTSGFPPETFGDLKLPVVDENGFLNLRALRMAKRAASQVSGVDEDLEEKVNLMSNALIKSNFPSASITESLEEVDEEWEKEEVTEYLEEKFDLEGVEEMATHTPSYSSVATGRSWDGLNMEDFDTDDLSEIDDHFIVSDSGFPPDSFGDLSFEVVDTDGALVREAVDSAWGLRGQADEDIENILLNLNDAFDDPPIDTESEENAEGSGDDEEVEETEEPQTTYKRIIIED